MRGLHYSTDTSLPQRDLHDLVDLLALQLFQQFGRRVYLLTRQDVAELVAPFIQDLCPGDRQGIPWLVWDLLQEGLDIELQH